MSTTKAIVIQAAKDARIQSIAVPTLKDDNILVQTKAVALNPTDWKHIDYLASPGARVGCDYSGVVLAVGSKVTNGLKVGDRVWGLVHGSNAVDHEDGGFGEVITARGDIQSRIPDNLSFEEAATLGVGVFTVGQGLYQSLGLPLPSLENPPAASDNYILIYGGSTATGALAIQYAKLSGWKVVTTASPRNFDYLKSLGADKVFDYNSASVAADIRAYTNNAIKHVFDCVSEGSSLTISANSFGPEGGIYSALLTIDAKVLTSVNSKITVKNTLAYTAMGRAFTIGANALPAIPSDFEFAKKFAVLSNSLLAASKIKVHTPSVNESGAGLEGVLKGLQLMREGKVSGKKLVYTLAPQIKAIVIQGPKDARVVNILPPVLRDDFILVQNKAVALNPTDWKHIDYFASQGARVGCDYAGVVLEVGPKVTNGLKKGDRVWGVVHGSNAVNHEDGSFGEIIAAKGDIQSKIPDNLSFEDAATLGVGIFTVGQGLYQSLGLPHPSATPTPTNNTILIYGGSTATGALAIQFAKLSGWKVVTTASPRNFDYLTSLGADKIFDYNSPTVAADIRAYTNNTLTHVFDCVSEGSSIPISANAISTNGGTYSNLLGVEASKLTSINPAIVVKSTMAYTVIGKGFKMGDWLNIPDIPSDFEFAKGWAVLSNSLLASGKVKVHTPSVNEGGVGLEGVLHGLQLMREGKVSGKKLVYTL